MRRKDAPSGLCVFVYGTLKQGYWNHDFYCRRACDIRPAEMTGLIYQDQNSIPFLQIPKENVLLKGSSDRVSDIRKQLSPPPAPDSATLSEDGEWKLVRGELITFPDEEKYLARLDELEEFDPPRLIVYTRVLAQAHDLLSGRTVPAWTYIIEPDEGDKYVGAVWPKP